MGGWWDGGGQSEVIIIKSCVISKEMLELYILYFKCGDAGRVDVDIGCINFEPTYHVGKGKVSQKIKSHKVS